MPRKQLEGELAYFRDGTLALVNKVEPTLTLSWYGLYAQEESKDERRLAADISCQPLAWYRNREPWLP